MKLCLSLAALALSSAALPVLADEINIYSHRQPELIQPLIDVSTAETGIAVNVAFVDKGMAERLVAEGDRSPADLIMTVDIARLQQIVDADVIQPVQSNVLEANIPETLRDEGDRWFGLTTRARIVHASKERVQPGEVTTYEDLGRDKWKGRICTRSGTHDYNVALLAAVIAHHGEDAAKAWAAGVKANLARQPEGGDRDRVKAIWAGECDIAIGNTLLHRSDAGRPRTGGVGRKREHRVPDLHRRRHACEHFGRGDDQGGAEQGQRAEVHGMAVRR